MFYTIVQNGKTIIQKTTSRNGKDWSASSTIVSKPPGRGFYTLSGLNIDKHICLLVESTTHSRRHQTLLYCDQGDGTFVPSKNNPVMVDRDWEKKWNTIRYGFHLLPDKGKYIVYHNVLPHLGAESGGQIVRSELNMNLLENSALNLLDN